MSGKEVRDYLNNYLDSIHGNICYMNALRRYADRLKPYLHIPELHGSYLAIMDKVREERAALDKRSVTVREWSELISDPTRRQIFIDRYINGIRWEDLQIKYSYCPSSIFRINKLICNEIAKQLNH